MPQFDFFGGIDFSGAKEPLSNVWSVVGCERGGKLHIVTLCPHPFRADLCGHVASGWRGAAGAAEEATVLWGAAFPFGLPAAAATHIPGRAGGANWSEVLAWVADRSAEEVREHLAELHKAPRRTDHSGNAPPLDARQYKQTVEGMRWLAELREAAATAVFPQMPDAAAHTALVEVNPAATLRDLGIRCRRMPSRPGEVRARPAALRPFLTFADPLLENLVVALEDAWDATLACLTAWLVRDDLDQPERLSRQPREVVALEGWVYRPPAAVG